MNTIYALHEALTKASLSEKELVAVLRESYQVLYETETQDSAVFDLPKEALLDILQHSFASRIALQATLSVESSDGEEVSRELLAAVYDINRALRYVEDYLLEILMKDQVTAQSYTTLQGEEPYFMTPDGQSFSSYDDLKSGDVILSRGGAYLSAAIARIGVNDTQFSHLSFLYRNPEEGGKLYTIEAHVEIGAVVAPFEVHIDQKNSRSVVYRYEDCDMAHKAAEYMFNLVKKHSDAGANIEYNFSMMYQDSERLFCSQVIHEGFRVVSDQRLDIPFYKTRYNPGLLVFLNQLGVPASPENIDTLDTFAPGDIEYDPRFTLIAEWKDPQQLKDSRYKDAILTKVFSWMEEEQYVLDAPRGVGILSHSLWYMRRTPLVRRLFTSKFPLNMDKEQLEMIMTIDKVGEVLSEELVKLKKAHNDPLSMKELFRLLDTIKERDAKEDQPLFHQWFHPK